MPIHLLLNFKLFPDKGGEELWKEVISFILIQFVGQKTLKNCEFNQYLQSSTKVMVEELFYEVK